MDSANNTWMGYLQRQSPRGHAPVERSDHAASPQPPHDWEVAEQSTLAVRDKGRYPGLSAHSA